MLPELQYGQNIFVEITNLVHGGAGWELATCLWSPQKNSNGKKTWKIMEQVKPDDFIIHLVDIKNKYHWYGISQVASDLLITNISPTEPGPWANMAPYQRINVKDFLRINNPVPINDFFNEYDSQLRKILVDYPKGEFYVLYDNQLRMGQRYFAKCPVDLYNLFDDYSNKIGFNPFFGIDDFIPTANEPLQPDYYVPGRIPTNVSRIIRNTRLIHDLKEQHNRVCQICGTNIYLPNGNTYCEGHHLQPLGGEHLGPDAIENIILLCPNHHTEFDYGCIAISPESLLIEHIDNSNSYHRQPLAYQRNNLGKEFIQYHYDRIYNK